MWAYGFAVPPLRPLARRLLAAARAIALALLLWLLAQPVLDRALSTSRSRVVVLVDRSRSMERPATAGGPPRRAVADRAVEALRRDLRGRTTLEVRGFASALQGDSTVDSNPDASAPGDALAALARLPVERRPDGVIVVSDGAVNAGADPVAAARSLGVPVHALLVGERAGVDRAIADVEASSEARVGEATTVRARITSEEERGTPIGVKLLDEGRELARATVVAPGPGAEVTAEFRVVPSRAGLAVWTARVDSLAGDPSPDDDAHGVAVPVAPGKLGVLVISSGLQWDLAFIRRALAGDSTVTLQTRVRDRALGWRSLEGAAGAPTPTDLRGRAVVVLDAISAADIGPAFEAALQAFVREGGGLLLLGGPAPGVSRFARGRLARDLAIPESGAPARTAAPQPQGAGAELLAWDDDPARGSRAWRAAAPLAEVRALVPGAGDAVLISAQDGGTPLWLARHIGRGQALFVNGTGLWRWSLSGTDDLAGERGRRLWRRVVRWLAEPVQGEPLRVRPERRLVPGGETVRLVATLQDPSFRPVAGAQVRGEIANGAGRSLPVSFVAGASGSYVATFPAPGPGRWQVNARASKDGRELGRTRSEFAVDRWSLEALRAQPDSAAMEGMAQASGGRFGLARDLDRWVRGLEARALVRARSSSTRLWESPWVFAVVVGLLSAEWAWRRRRGLP